MQPTAKNKILIADCLRQDQRAQYTLYRQYVKAMYHTVVRMVPSTVDAEDIVQETFVKVFQKLDTFQGTSTLGAWIKRIAINTALNHLRRERRGRIINVEDHEFVETADDHNYPPAPPLDMRNVHEAIKTLPEGCRVVLSLYLLEGYKHQEIAEILQITVSTSKSQYHRAKKLLKAKLNNKMQ